jgi:hypothetical protein
MSRERIPTNIANVLAANTLPTRREINRAFNQTDDPYSLFLARFHDEVDQFEVLNSEFVAALADYLVKRAIIIKGQQNPATILEVGAGRGRLSHFLALGIGRTANNSIIIATDSGEYGIKPMHPVEKLDVKAGLAQYNPDIIIASWMPNGVDWTRT